MSPQQPAVTGVGGSTSVATEPSTSTFTINAAFLQSVKDLNRGLWRDVETLQQWCFQPLSVRVRSCRKVVGLLAETRDKLGEHFSLEEFYGYFLDPFAESPWLMNRAAELRSEHVSLYVQLSGLAELAEWLFLRGRRVRLAERIAANVIAFCDQLLEHETAENDLIMKATCDDIGICDSRPGCLNSESPQPL